MPSIQLAAAVMAAGTMLLNPLVSAETATAPQPAGAATEAISAASKAKAEVRGQKVSERRADGDTATVSGAGPFKGAGVSWDASGPEVTEVKMRLKAVDGGYGPWETMELHDAETIHEGRLAANILLSVQDADAAQVKVSTADGSDPSDVRIHLVNPGTMATDGDRVGTTVSALNLTSSQVDKLKPTVLSRAQWGADESKRTWRPAAITPKAVAIHHTASSNNYTREQAPAQLRSIYLYQAVSLGWGDIGYSFLVDKYGTAYEGQYGSLQQIHVGGHTSGYNGQVLAISALGNYETAAAPQAMVDKIEALAAWQMAKYKIDPAGSVSLTNVGGRSNVIAPVGATTVLPTIFGHYSTSYTACPGANLIKQLPQIRKDTAARMAAAASSGSTTSTAGTYTVRPGDGWWIISQRTGVSATQLQRLNGMSSSTVLRPGMVLKTGSSSPSTPVPAPSTTPTAGTYTVRPGDGWWLISQKTGVSMTQLHRLNGMSASTLLHPGMVLKTGSSSPSTPVLAPATATVSGTYTVKPGDGWWLISQNTGVSMTQLHRLNGMSASTILHPGMVLKV